MGIWTGPAGGTITVSGGGGGGDAHTHGVLFSMGTYEGSVTADAAETATTLTLDDVSDARVGMYWSPTSKVTSIDSDANTVTLSGAIGEAIEAPLDVKLYPLIGVDNTLSVPGAAYPFDFWMWGLVDSGNFWMSRGRVVDAHDWYYSVNAARNIRASRNLSDDAGGVHIGAAFPGSYSEGWYSVNYNHSDGTIGWDPSVEGLTNVPVLRQIMFSN